MAEYDNFDPPDIGLVVKHRNDLVQSDSENFLRMQEIRFQLAALDAQAEKHWSEVPDSPWLDQILTVSDVATILQFHEHTILSLVHDGAIPFVKIGDSIRFSRSRIFGLFYDDPREAPVADQVLTAEQVAQLFKLHYRTVCELAREGKIPVIKIGDSYRGSLRALLDFASRGGKSDG